MQRIRSAAHGGSTLSLQVNTSPASRLKCRWSLVSKTFQRTASTPPIRSLLLAKPPILDFQRHSSNAANSVENGPLLTVARARGVSLDIPAQKLDAVLGHHIVTSGQQDKTVSLKSMAILGLTQSAHIEPPPGGANFS